MKLEFEGDGEYFETSARTNDFGDGVIITIFPSEKLKNYLNFIEKEILIQEMITQARNLGQSNE